MSRWGGLGMYWLQEGEKYWRFSNRLWLRTIELRSDDNWSDFLLTFLSCVRGSASLTESCQPNLLWKLQQEPKIQNTICSELWALSAATPYSDNCQSGAALIISCSAVINTLGSSPLPPQVMSCPICVYLLTNEFFVSRVVTVLKVTAAHNMSSDTANPGQHQHKHSISFSFQTQKLDHWLLKQLELYQEYLGRQPGSWVANTSPETLTRQLAC